MPELPVASLTLSLGCSCFEQVKAKAKGCGLRLALSQMQPQIRAAAHILTEFRTLYLRDAGGFVKGSAQTADLLFIGQSRLGSVGIQDSHWS